MNTAEYKIYASPKLMVTTQNYQVNLTGSVDISQAMIQPTAFNNIITLPNDQIVYTAGKPQDNKITWSIFTDLNVRLGNNIRINASGFNATIVGQVRIIGKPETMALARGRISIVKGSYNAYGRKLTIMPSSYVQFVNGPANNPNFNIRATRLIRTIGSFSSTRFGSTDIMVGGQFTWQLPSS